MPEPDGHVEAIMYRVLTVEALLPRLGKIGREAGQSTLGDRMDVAVEYAQLGLWADFRIRFG